MTPQSIRSAKAHLHTNKCITIVYHRNKQYLHILTTNPNPPFPFFTQLFTIILAYAVSAGLVWRNAHLRRFVFTLSPAVWLLALLRLTDALSPLVKLLVVTGVVGCTAYASLADSNPGTR